MNNINTAYITWIEISKSALEHNVNQYRNWLPEKTGIAPVVKANAYGHGLPEIGLLHEHNNHVVRLCVASTSEAVALRNAGIKKPILVLGYIDTLMKDIAIHGIDMIVSDIATLHELQKIGKQYNTIINIHLKIDTGLSRLGFFPKEVDVFFNEVKKLPNVHLQGICSHFIEASNPNSVHEQEELLRPLYRPNIQMHTSNSHGSLHTKYFYNFARIGAGLYGYLPEADEQLQNKLKPILSLKTKVISIKHIDQGCTVGYGRTYCATKPTKLAILGMGYYEGIDPDLSNTGKVLIHGQFAPIVGRINMNYFTVDVTHIPQTQTHDIATVLGKDGDNIISAYDWRIGAKKNVRIFLAKLNNSIPRIVID